MTLVKKEFLEHRWVLLALMPLLFFGFLLSVASVLGREVGSPFEVVRIFSLSFLIIGEMIICNRLVVQEYQGKTQLFLEGLPISRAGMLMTKYLLGLVFFVFLSTAVFCLTALYAMNQEPITSRFFQIMASRLLVYTLFTYTFFFMMGLLGRYRIAIYLFLIVAAMILTKNLDFQLDDYGPLALVDDQFAYQRIDFPVKSLWTTLVAAVAMFAISLLMAVTREGSVASMLAERMSQREKVFVAAGLIGCLVCAFMVDQKKKPDPYQLAYATTREQGEIVVHVESDLDEQDPVGEALAEKLVADLVELKQYLNMENTPPLFVLNRRDLDSEQYEFGKLSNAEGVLLRVNFRSDDWTYQQFRSRLIDIYLSEATQYRGTHEPRCWVLEGFAEYWALRGEIDDQWNQDCQVTLRAAYAANQGLSSQDIRDWFLFRERVGRDIASATACAALMHAHRVHGPETVQAFASEILRSDLPNDLRSTWQDIMRPVPVVWHDTTNSNYQDFETDWIASITDAGESFADVLDNAPKLTTTSTPTAKSTETFELAFDADVAHVPSDGLITTRYEVIGALDGQSNGQDAKEDTWNYNESRQQSLPETFPVGTRLRWTLSVRSELLGCDVISGWQREELR